MIKTGSFVLEQGLWNCLQYKTSSHYSSFFQQLVCLFVYALVKCGMTALLRARLPGPQGCSSSMAAKYCRRWRRECARRGCNGCFREGDGCTLRPAAASDCCFASDVSPSGGTSCSQWGWGVVRFHQTKAVTLLWLSFYCLCKDLWPVPPLLPPHGAIVTAALVRCFKGACEVEGGRERGEDGRTEREGRSAILAFPKKQQKKESHCLR